LETLNLETKNLKTLSLDCDIIHLLDALTLYSEKGRVDFALHNAIKDKNLIASVVLTNYAKDVNTKKINGDCAWINNRLLSKLESRASARPFPIKL